MPKLQIPQPAPPLPRSYWVIEGAFLAGAYSGSADPIAHRKRLSGLFLAGSRTFVNLMQENETNNVGKPFVRYDDDLKEIAAEANERVVFRKGPPTKFASASLFKAAS